MKLRSSKFLLFLALLSIGATSTPQYEVSVSTVTVWIKAVDRSGKPVEGLTQNDFVVFEDKEQVPVTCFEENRAAPATTGSLASGNTKIEESSAPKFVLYLDLFNTAPRELAAVRPALQRFIDSLADQKREVMVAAFTSTGRLGVIVPFTTKLAPVHSLLERARANSARAQFRKQKDDELNQTLEGAGDDLVDRLRDGYQMARRFSAEERRATQFTLRALSSFASYLTKLNLGDHAVLVYVSGGFSADPGRHYFDIVDRLGESASKAEEYMTVAQERQSNFDFGQELRKTIGKLDRFNVTLYSIDAAGRSDEYDYQNSLIQIAEETGGLAFSNSQNFQVGITQMAADLDHQYTICYKPPVHKKAGDYHSIKVRCNRPGIELRHRLGYVD